MWRKKTTFSQSHIFLPFPPLLTYNEFECRLTRVSSLENLPFSSVIKRKSCHKIPTIVNMSDDCDNISNLFINIIQSDFNGLLKLLPVTLLLGHWYEIMALYYVKSILTEISASRQDRRVLQKSKIIRIEFLSKWGMLQTSRYV